MLAQILLVISLFGFVIGASFAQSDLYCNQSIAAIDTVTSLRILPNQQNIYIIPGLSSNQLITIVDKDGGPLSFKRIDNDKVDLGHYNNVFRVRILTRGEEEVVVCKSEDIVNLPRKRS